MQAFFTSETIHSATLISCRRVYYNHFYLLYLAFWFSRTFMLSSLKILALVNFLKMKMFWIVCNNTHIWQFKYFDKLTISCRWKWLMEICSLWKKNRIKNVLGSSAFSGTFTIDSNSHPGPNNNNNTEGKNQNWPYLNNQIGLSRKLCATWFNLLFSSQKRVLFKKHKKFYLHFSNNSSF